MDAAQRSKVALDEFIPIEIPPAGEVLAPRRRPISLAPLVSNGRVRAKEEAHPLVDGERDEFGLLARDRAECLDEVVPVDPVARDLELLARRRGAIVEDVAREEAEVLERNHGHVACSDGAREDVRAVGACLERPEYTLQHNVSK